MDDSPVSTNNRIPLGMSAFGKKERQQLGQNLKLAMACMKVQLNLSEPKQCLQMKRIFANA